MKHRIVPYDLEVRNFELFVRPGALAHFTWAERPARKCAQRKTLDSSSFFPRSRSRDHFSIRRISERFFQQNAEKIIYFSPKTNTTLSGLLISDQYRLDCVTNTADSLSHFSSHFNQKAVNSYH